MAATLTPPVAGRRLARSTALQRAPRDRPLPTLDDVTRRDLLKGATALLVATACGTDGDPALAPSPTAATRTVEHALGTSQIPVDARRIVTLNPFASLDSLVAVGVTPVGSTGDPAADYPYGAWLEGRTEGVQMLGFTGEEDLERIALLEPEVILANPWQEDAYPQLSEITPTVGVPLSYQDYLRSSATSPTWSARARRPRR